MKLASINEAAQALGKSPQQLRRGIDAGRYPYVAIGSRKLVDVDELSGIVQRENATIGIKEAAELTGLPPSAIRRGAREGWIPCRKTGKSYELLPGELLAAIEKLKVTK